MINMRYSTVSPRLETQHKYISTNRTGTYITFTEASVFFIHINKLPNHGPVINFTPQKQKFQYLGPTC